MIEPEEKKPVRAGDPESVYFLPRVGKRPRFEPGYEPDQLDDWDMKEKGWDGL